MEVQPAQTAQTPVPQFWPPPRIEVPSHFRESGFTLSGPAAGTARTRSVMDSPALHLPTTEDEQKFTRLKEEWRADTRFLSSSSNRILHPAYLGIIGMGKPAILLLLRELGTSSTSWFVALRAITQEDPVDDSTATTARQMAEVWMAWGRNRGYRF